MHITMYQLHYVVRFKGHVFETLLPQNFTLLLKQEFEIKTYQQIAHDLTEVRLIKEYKMIS